MRGLVNNNMSRKLLHLCNKGHVSAGSVSDCSLLNLHAWVACRFGAASYVPALSLEKPLYVRERNDGLYRPITYLLAKLFDELFITLFASVIFALIVWYLIQVSFYTVLGSST
jgi:ABC-2 type transporter